MATLNNKINDILTEKTLKVRPENIKNGVTILGIEGTYEGTVPTGTINITQNGITDVTTYANANVNVEAIGEKDVNFYDYDGTLVNSYTKTEFLALNAMPANPTHTGLVAEGWNWTLSDAKDFVTTYGKLIIGQNYTTLSGKCEFDIELNAATGLTLPFAATGTKNWGDGTTDTATSHTYANYGEYTIICDCVALPQDMFSQSSPLNYTVKNIRLSGVELQGVCLRNCGALETISISANTTLGSSGNGQFNGCLKLRALVIPPSFTTLSNSFCYTDASLEVVCLPKTISSLGTSSFRSASCLRAINIPPAVEAFETEQFRLCTSLKELIFPAGFTTIKSNNTFNYCVGLEVLDFSHATSVPSLGTGTSTIFGSVSKLCKIIVPDALYTSWTTAQYWSSIANQIVKASEA